MFPRHPETEEGQEDFKGVFLAFFRNWDLG
jgi:hypothetical protein